MTNPLETDAFALLRLDARTILTKCSAVLGLLGDSGATAAMSLQCQAVLVLPGHRFDTLISEEALLRTVGRAPGDCRPDPRAGADPDRARPRRDRHRPSQRRVHASAGNFVIHDSSRVDSEAVTESIEANGDDEIVLAERIFDLLAVTAVYGEDARAILDQVLASHAGSRHLTL